MQRITVQHIGRRSVHGGSIADALSASNLESCLKNLQNASIGPPKTGKEVVKLRSAVLVSFCTTQGNKPSLLFNLRSNRLPRHKGYVCFPGGMQDEDDAHAIDTALRETEEELGIARKDVRVVGVAPPLYNPMDQLSITAVIGVLHEGSDIDIQRDLVINEAEVQLAFTRTLEELCELKNLRWTQFRKRYGGYSIPVFVAGQYKIWGLTAIILNAVLRALLPGQYVHRTRYGLLNPKYYKVS
ncbi:mitochondrial coenzyme A diphosphatase NUDT8-like [Ornithodoros turicata]|uniref:mitochondrial coenzyme A diphosphatase NUDT8-like n=1 Tax=Ornithodoros turicata TaxID=34597 RepID=UPI003139D00F